MHKNAQQLLQKIQYLIGLTRFKEAETYLHELLSQIPDHIHGLALLSLCHLNLGDLPSDSKTPTDGESFRGFKLSLKSEVKWFRPFIQYIAYSIKGLLVLSVGILGGLTSQAGNIATTAWEDGGFLLLITKIFLGFLLFFWFPFFLSALIGLKLAKQDDFKHIFGGEEKQFEQKHVAIFVIVASVFIGLLFFT